DLPAPVSSQGLPHLALVGSPWFYEGYPRDLILGLKLRGRRVAAAPLGAAIAGWLDRHGTGATAITWVPGRKRDMRARGFDHAEAIARVASSLLGLPALSLLTRTSERPDQTTLDALQRRRNLVGAFTAATSPKAILLIDDLMTTGATLIACAQALKASGAGHVEGVTACRV
ncbi:MAG: hypothetical protein M3277_10800, partial [Actinomycetota bacterium]|nr:hypothetical protein [Actinomycetota bacterium]